MDHHFRAFSFVDRITAVEPGARIRGEYLIPSGLTSFAPSLAAEAVGQLAAWAAMARMDFARRPVAGLAGEIELLHPIRPGQRLELVAELDTVEADAAAYGGSVLVDGILAIRLTHCVGPMLPVEDFDDPSALRARYGVLCNGGATPGGFGGLPAFPLERTGGEAGQRVAATLHVPTQADFFADHFPRRPVFPGTLLMNASLDLAALLAQDMATTATGAAWALRSVSDVKLRAFTPPGDVLEIEARLNELSPNAATVKVDIRKGKRIVGGARVQLAAGERV
jgi:3-hydroxymyristoyl/3-hydroxydecanoyl-(acyl carrier protein) dehydratase